MSGDPALVRYDGIGLAVFFYLLTGFGVTVGFHRCLTHRSFTARPALRVALAVAGSHSPYRYGTGLAGQLRGVLHAHAGWLFGSDATPQRAYAPDMLADPAMRGISRAFPALCAASLALPFGIGWAISGPRGALLALLWAGLIRAFERAGWVSGVRWPDAGRLEQRRRQPEQAATHVQASPVPASVLEEPGRAALR